MSGSLRAGSWVVLDNVVAAATAFLFFVVSARLLPPHEFGVAAIAISISQILLPMIDSLFHDAVIQRKELEEDDIQVAFSATLIWSLAIAVGLVLCAPWIADLTNAPSLSTYLPWMAISALASGVMAVPSALARRHMQFRALATRTVMGRSIATAIGLLLLFNGGGIWSVVVQAILFNVLGALFLAVSLRPSFRMVFNWSRLRPMLSFAGAAMGTQFLLFAGSRVFTLMFSAFLGPVAAATWTVAMRFVEPLQMVAATVVGQLSLPSYARMQSDAAGLRDLFLTGSRRSSLILVPMFVGLGACSRPVIETFAGAQWLDAAPLMAIICLVAAVVTSRQLVEITLTSLGLPHLNLSVQLLAILLSLIGFTIGVNDGLLGATIGWSLRVLPFVTLSAYLMKRRAGAGLWTQFRVVAPIYAASGIMAVAVVCAERLMAGWHPLVTMMVAVVTGALVYFPALLLLDAHIRSDVRMVLARRRASAPQDIPS